MHPVDIKSDAERRPSPPLPDARNRHWAWFLDVDGTLLEIERRPDLVIADNRLLRLLNELNKACDGAVALVSGRSLEMLEAIFDPLTLPAGASHGLELRLPDGNVRHIGEAIPSPFTDRIAAFTAEHDGLVFERKPFSVGVHFRARPELERTVLETMERIHAELDGNYRLLRGKMVVEILPAAADKGTAIECFMKIPPFASRRPVFVGDDITDEDGFAAVNDLDGISVRIGDAGSSTARWQVANVSELRGWLQAALQAL